MQEGLVGNGIAIDDNVAVHFIDQEIAHIIRRNTHGNAYRVFRNDTGIHEDKIHMLKLT